MKRLPCSPLAPHSAAGPAERDGAGGSDGATGRLGRAGREEGERGRTAVPRVQMEKSSAARAETDGLLDFFLERERRRAGIDLSSLPISLKFQINKIHFSAPLPSPAQQTKEKQFPAVCSKLLSQFRGFLTSASGSCRGPGEPWLWGRAGEGAQRAPVIQRCLRATNGPAPKPWGTESSLPLQTWSRTSCHGPPRYRLHLPVPAGSAAAKVLKCKTLLASVSNGLKVAKKLKLLKDVSGWVFSASFRCSCNWSISWEAVHTHLQASGAERVRTQKPPRSRPSQQLLVCFQEHAVSDCR